jgi:uncharacterized protein YifE (UPF0438 family)
MEASCYEVSDAAWRNSGFVALTDYSVGEDLMLSASEITELDSLIVGNRSPVSGIEKHFVRVMSGEAIPCSAKEKEWYQHWQRASSDVPRPDDHQQKYEEASQLLHDSEETITELKRRVAHLERSTHELDKLIAARDSAICGLKEQYAAKCKHIAELTWEAKTLSRQLVASVELSTKLSSEASKHKRSTENSYPARGYDDVSDASWREQE